jgi:hypothetical protein
MNRFFKGQAVRCIDSFPWNKVLTEGNLYIVRDTREDGIKVQTDDGEETWFHTPRFAPISTDNESAPALQPLKIENEQIYMYDVDDTLVMWTNHFTQPGEGRVRIVDPYDQAPVYLKPHERHVKLLKQMHGRGRYIVVWSQSGVQWAHAVVEALGLSDFVHLVMTKPTGYVDDLPADQWMRDRIYLPTEETEK